MNRITVICLILSFLFYFGGASSPTEPSIVIRKPVISQPQIYPQKSRVPKWGYKRGMTVVLIDPFGGFPNDLQTVNIAVQPGKCITYKFCPSTPPPATSYYFEVIFEGVTQNSAFSASFTIGRPKFGITITHPVTDTTVHCGGELKVRWKDPFKLYKSLNFDTFYLFEHSQGAIQFSPPAVNVPISAGKKTVRIPLGLKNSHNYNVVVFVFRNGRVEQYNSDEFGISGC